MKLKKMMILVSLLAFASVARAQSHTGNGTINGDYNNYVTEYESYLPDCTTPPTSPASPDPTEWLNKISYVFIQSLGDAERDFKLKPDTAYLRLKAALDAVSDKTQNCRDLRSILSRPIANQTLKAIQILEDTIDNTDEIGKPRVLYDFSRSAVIVANKAATTVDQTYFVPYAGLWDPRTGFFGHNGATTVFQAPSPDAFAQQMLDIAGDELLLVDALGYNAGHYYYYNGVKNAYLPVADEIVSSVYATLKTNLLVMSKVTAFIQLEILKNDINHYLTSVDPTLSFPVIVQDVHNRIDRIASELRSCSFQTRY